MEKRIYKSSHGDYRVEWGKSYEEQPNPVGIGFIMAGFMVYKISRYDTLEEAKKAEWKG